MSVSTHYKATFFSFVVTLIAFTNTYMTCGNYPCFVRKLLDYFNRNKNSGNKPVSLVNDRTDFCGSYVVPVFCL